MSGTKRPLTADEANDLIDKAFARKYPQLRFVQEGAGVPFECFEDFVDSRPDAAQPSASVDLDR